MCLSLVLLSVNVEVDKCDVMNENWHWSFECIEGHKFERIYFNTITNTFSFSNG